MVNFAICRNAKWFEIFYSDRIIEKTVFVWKTLHHIKCNTKCAWRARLVEGPELICRWCYLRHGKLAGVWVQKLLPASSFCDIWLGRKHSVLPTDQISVSIWSRSDQQLTSGPHSWAWTCRTYGMAPYGRMLSAMLVCWHCPRASVQTLVNSAHSLSHGTERLGLPWRYVAAVWGWKEREGSQATESNKSDRSQRSWQWIWLLMCGSYQRAAALERWPVTYWSALTTSKWCCKKQT